MVVRTLLTVAQRGPRGYGYTAEYPMARAYADARVTTVYAGTAEIMKEIIGRSLGL
jgi:alkylation response protein AidB-like acyl-CoA dehydrogenase